MESHALYDEVRLGDPEADIRLLRIFETSPKIRCELKTFPLEDCQPFCAISYTWGDATDKREIVVNGKPVEITKSLFDALSHVQPHWTRAVRETEAETLWLWADALCIDQTNEVEKSHQVPRMKDIYSAAKTTFCSLQSVTDDSKLPKVLESLSVIAERLEERKLSDDLHSYKVAQEVFENLPSPVVDGAAFMGYYYLVELPYWSRAWIFQELLSSQRLLVFYADHEFDLVSHDRIKAWAEQIRVLSQKDPLPNSISAVISCLGISWILPQVMTYRRYALSVPTAALSPEETKTLQVTALLMGNALQLRATEPKDYVYALLGVTGLDIQPRYDKEMTVADVYVDFCTRYTDLVKSHPVILPLEYLNRAGLANGSPETLQLPTWVPNFPGCEDYDSEYVINALDYRERERADFDKYPWRDETLGRFEDISIRQSSLLTTSLVIDSLAEISTIMDSSMMLLPDREAARGHYHSWLIGVFGMMKKIFELANESFSSDEHPLTKLCGAFFHERVDWPSPKLVRGFEFLRRVYLFTDETMRSFNLSAELCLKQPGRHDTGETAAVLRELQGKLGFLDYIIGRRDQHNRTGEDVYRFGRRGIRVGRTACNNFAIVPPEAEVGDEIMLLTGYDNLSLIRRVDDHHIYVGPVGFERQIADKRIQEATSAGEELPHIEIR